MDTIDQLIEKSARTHQNLVAIKYKTDGRWRDLRYAELWSIVERLAAGLLHSGVQPEEPIALYAASSANWVISYLAILKTGACVVPIDKELKSFELLHILKDSEAKVIFTDNKGIEALKEIGETIHGLEKIVDISTGSQSSPALSPVAQEDIAQLLDAWQTLKETRELTSSEIASIEGPASAIRQVLLGDPGLPSPPLVSGKSRPLSHFFSLRTSMIPMRDLLRDETPPSPRRDSGATAIILYTSGTTGRSKGAMLSHHNIVTNITASIAHFDLKLPLTTLSFLPINHVFEQVCGILLPLSLGGTVAFAESLKKIGENLQEIRPTFFLGVPALYNLLLERIQRKISSHFSSRILYTIPITRPLVTKDVRKAFDEKTLFVSGGAPLDPDTSNAFRMLGFKLLQGYGITETSPVITAERPDETRPGTVGKPIAGVEIRIDAPNDDGIGEILVRGPNVMQGYYKNPEATAEVLVDGWYRTGDLGRIDVDGFLSISGRIKNLIVTPNGKNVYPEEVEGELVKSPYICEAMVYGHKAGNAGEEVCAVIYPDYDAIASHWGKRDARSAEPAEIEEIIRQEIVTASRKLADYKRIKRFALRDVEFPKTATRKIKRFTVEAQIPTVKP